MAVQLRAGNSGASSTGLAEALGHGLPVVTNASAATELPSGTVHLVTPDLTPGSLALDIRRVLGDGAFRERLRAGALDYARSATFDHAAAQMLDIARWNRGR
jgi:D-inositol-3-phosphate glycosyltransferase